MLTEYFKSPETVERLRSGIAGGWLGGFAGWLRQARYSLVTIRLHLVAAGHLSFWATGRRLQPMELDESAAAAFESHLGRCRCEGFRCGERRRTASRVRSFIEYLKELGVVSPARAVSLVPPGPPLLVEFWHWMVQSRGVSEVTVERYCRTIRGLLETLGEDPSRYDAHGLRRFILDYTGRRGRSNAKDVVTSVRMFVRFLSSQKRCSAGLVAAIPSVAGWSQASLPRYLASDAIERVVQASTQGRHPRRDRAILLLLCRLALRAGDVSSLRLSDIDWYDATLRVCGKGRRETLLPLTQEVGDALLDYVENERPAVSNEHVFVRGEAPFRSLARTTISAIAGAAIRRAGVRAPSYGAHILRHSVATEMLRRGASLSDIGTILRHRCVNTTAVYAKVDIATLKLVSQPWPEVSPC